MDNGVQPVFDMNNRDSDGMYGGGYMWVMMLFFLLAWGGNGFGGWNNNSRQCATTEDVQNQFNFAALERQMNEGVAATRQASYDVSTIIKDQAYNALQNLNQIGASVAQLGYQQSQCCCETNRNIDSVKFENAQNTCTVTNAIHAEGEATRALITQNEMQALRDKLADEKLANSQCAQNAYLIGQLQPVAKPAYITASPYTANSCCGSYANI